jgi:phosphatidate cytidylyltransferase
VSKNLLSRIAVAAVAIPIILTICYAGGFWYFGMIALFALSATTEFLINEGYRPRHVAFWLTLVFIFYCLWSAFCSFAGSDRHGDYRIWLHDTPGYYVFFFLVSGMVAVLGKSSPADLYRKQSRLFWGIFYLGFLYSFVLALGAEPRLDLAHSLPPHADLRGPTPHGDLLLFLFGLLWIGDTCAMGFGKWLGKHKLAPSVSPNKTVEGFVGGVIGAAAVGMLMYYWKFEALNLSLTWTMTVAIGCSIFGQLGDLVESMWKRSLGIKDSSVIIPGHGGVLDRFDSLLFAAPFLYFCVMPHFVEFRFW